MSLNLFKGLKYGLLLILVFIFGQFLYLSYQVVITTAIDPELKINLKQIKKSLQQLPTVKNKSPLVQRQQSWPQLKTDNLFKTSIINSKVQSGTSKADSYFELLTTFVFEEAERNLALLKINTTNKSHIVKAGAVIANYQVQEINSQQVLLVKDEKKIRVELSQPQQGGK